MIPNLIVFKMNPPSFRVCLEFNIFPEAGKIYFLYVKAAQASRLCYFLRKYKFLYVKLGGWSRNFLSRGGL
jgi:hypothetical protein